jgi:hypothetical protein
VATPIRTCVGCRARDAQAALVRLVAEGGELVIDRARRRGGRGAYVHARRACVDAFARRGGFVRSLRCMVAKPERERARAALSEVQD